MCVPFANFFFCQVTAQVETLAQVASGLPSPVIVIEAMPIVEVAEIAIFTLPFGVAPFVGELTTTLGGEEVVVAELVVTETFDDWAELLPAAS